MISKLNFLYFIDFFFTSGTVMVIILMSCSTYSGLSIFRAKTILGAFYSFSFSCHAILAHFTKYSVNLAFSTKMRILLLACNISQNLLFPYNLNL